MADIARDAVTRQRRRTSASASPAQRIDHAVLKWLMLVQLDLPLAHHAVTAIAGVIKKAGLRRTHRFFGFELRVKIGSRPASPIIDARHSVYGEKLSGGCIFSSNRKAMFSVDAGMAATGIGSK